MLRKFIVICLVISTFGYGVAWAFDGHLDVPQTQTDASFEQLEDSGNPKSNQHNDTDCDHCCHANAHLVGIAAAGNKGLSANRSNLLHASTTILISFLAIPASPPPKL